MAVCHYCKQEIKAAIGCDAQTLYASDGRSYSRISYGDEQREGNGLQMEARCPNCHVIFGMLHHPGCMTEECPVCHKARMVCRCPLTVRHSSPKTEHAQRNTTAMAPVVAGQGTEGVRQRQGIALPTWRPTARQREDSLAAVRLGRLSGCWKRADCRITIAGGQVRHECGGDSETIPLTDDDEVVARMRARHGIAPAD